MEKIVFENSTMRFEINENCVATSLVHKPSGEECLAKEELLPIFSVTQERPFNNENKLIYMNKQTEFFANKVRREDNRLIVGFEIAPFEAVIEADVRDRYIAFKFVDFIVHPEDYDQLKMATPPVLEFKVLNLAVKPREKFGKWLNVVWDKDIAVNVLATTPETLIDAEPRKNAKILTANAKSEIKIKGCGAALIVSKTDELLSVVSDVEKDFGLPLGVESRKSDWVKRSIFWTEYINPTNVDEYIKYIKKCGFSLLLIYYKAIFKDTSYGWAYCGNYEYREEYPNGDADVKVMLSKLNAAGIRVGFHFLHTHIGMKSKYVTPRADRRLHLKRLFTLAKTIEDGDTDIYVDENPQGCILSDPENRILKFGTEIISYDGYTEEPPYKFTGCKRGALETELREHCEGEIGGLLDASEFCGTSVYLGQNSDLQDEIAEKIARTYNLGFEFAYFDGSEGTDAPFEYYVPLAQYRVYKNFNRAPLFAEGAAKAHFGWHMLSGANAFDIFPTDIFKKMIDKFPVVAAKEMQNDFTRVNFGWWQFFEDTQPDTYEYGLSRAIAWNCPATMIAKLETLKINPRTDDVLEAMRRWNEALEKGIISEDVKLSMRDSSDEYTLIINEKGEYEICHCEEISEIAKENVKAFIFERHGERCVSVWNTKGEGEISLPLESGKIKYLDEIAGKEIAISEKNGFAVLPVGSKKYIRTSLSKEEIVSAFKNSK